MCQQPGPFTSTSVQAGISAVYNVGCNVLYGAAVFSWSTCTHLSESMRRCCSSRGFLREAASCTDSLLNTYVPRLGREGQPYKALLRLTSTLLPFLCPLFRVTGRTACYVLFPNATYQHAFEIKLHGKSMLQRLLRFTWPGLCY